MLGLRKGLDLVKYEMNKQPANDAIHRFHDSAVHQVARIAEAFHRMEADYEKLCAQFGENYKSTESDDVFKPLLDFVKAFQVGARAGGNCSHHEDANCSKIQVTFMYARVVFALYLNYLQQL